MGISKIHDRVIEKQLQMSMMKKYLKKHLKKDVYLQKKNRKLLIT